MPKIPTYDAPRVSQQGLPGVRQSPSAPQVVDVQGVAARQNQILGRSLMQAGGAMADIALTMQKEANQLRVDDAMNQARELVQGYTFDKETGYLAAKGKDAIERQSGKPLAVEYADKLAEDFANISQGLGNDAQRRLFASFSRQELGRFQGQVMRHEADEYMSYRASVREGTIANRTQDIALNYDNPQAIAEGINSIKAAVWDLGKMNGWAGEKVEAEQRKATSKAHRTVLIAALQNNNLGYASSYFKQNLRDMEADDVLRIGGILQESSDLASGRYAADTTFQRFAHLIAPSEDDRAFEVLIGAESGGRQFDKDGKPLTSKAGAIGIAQVMPGTGPEAARLAGLPWDEERYKNDPEYNRALGKAYFDKQIKDFGGNLAQAYAAYNAGPRWVKEAVTRAEKANPGTQEADWFWQLNNDKRSLESRQQTQSYVIKNIQAFSAGLGQSKPTLLEMKAYMLRENPDLANNPTALKAAETALESRHKDMTSALDQQADEAYSTAIKALYQNGGQFSELPADIRAAIPPDKLTAVMNAAERIAKGDDTTSPWLYNKLTSEPGYLADLSDDEFYALRTSLSESDFKHFSKERAKARGAAGGGNPGDLNSQAIKTGLDTRLRMIGTDPAPKDERDAARVGAIRKFVNGYIVAAQQEAGKKFNDAEVEQHLDSLFMQSAEVRSLWGRLPFVDDASSMPILSMNVGDIDNTTKNSIKAAFKRAGNDSPTDAQILNAYWNLKVSRK